MMYQQTYSKLIPDTLASTGLKKVGYVASMQY